MLLLQLNPALPLNTPKGPGLCHVLIDYGPESHLYWVVILDSNGEVWTFANPEVRGQANLTLGRGLRGESPMKKAYDRARFAKEFGFDRLGDGCACCWSSHGHGDVCPEHGTKGIPVT